MPDIVTLTPNPALDKSCAVGQVAADRKLRCGPLRVDPGGGGINVARVIRRLGGEAIAVYPAGGPPGALLTDLLDREGIHHRPIPIAGWTREDFTATEESTGRQYRFVLQGPALNEEEWQACLEAPDQVHPAPRIVVASGSLPPGVPDDFYARLARRTRDRGGRLALDTSGEALLCAVRHGVWLLKPNLRELQHLARRETPDETQQARAAQEILERGGCEILFLSMGAGGALVATRDHRLRLRSPAVPIRSRVGAGDSTMAALVLALSRGWPVEEAARFAIAAGAAAVMRPSTDLCHRADVEALFEATPP